MTVAWILLIIVWIRSIKHYRDDKKFRRAHPEIYDKHGDVLPSANIKQAFGRETR